ncbi:MAG: PorT family protein [Bacteroidales bacterium]|nr:PorT family protein [Bacteroidales bacterium]
MKKKILFWITIILLNLVHSPVSSQEHRFGLLLGIDAVGVLHVKERAFYFEQPQNYLMLSYNINGSYSFKGKGKIGFSVEPGYIRKGAAFRDNAYTLYMEEDGKTKYRHHYLNMPILFDWYISKKLSLSIGPELGYLLSVTIKENNKVEKHEPYGERFQLSALIGINYEIMRYLDIGFRYNHELPFYKDSFYLFNQYFQLYLRFKINKP